MPQPGNFSLLGLEKKRVAILDKWDFDKDALPLSTQLLWFEGKPFPITRPQNKDYTGHLLYQGIAPISITCKEAKLGPIMCTAKACVQPHSACAEAMLLRRMRIYSLSVHLSIPVGRKVRECLCCFARLVTQYAAAAAAAGGS